MAVADPFPDLPVAAAVRTDVPTRSRPHAPPAVAVSVVVVNFCQWRNTARLTAQLRASAAMRRGSAEVVVVDNRSPAHRLARSLARRPGVSVVQNARNEGFARAVNRGVRASAGEWVLLLNPDVTVPPGFLDRALAAAAALTASDPRAGVVGFRLLNRDGSPQASAGSFPTLLSTALGLAVPRATRKCRPLAVTGRTAVAWVTGGCLLVRRECLADLGGLDEQFFLYYEDVDLCRRAASAGWSVWYDPAVTVTHHWPLHARAVPAPLKLITRHALLTYAGKHWPAWQRAALGVAVWAEARARSVFAARRGDPAGARSFRRLARLVGQLRRNDAAAVARTVRRAASGLGTVAAQQDGKTA